MYDRPMCPPQVHFDYIWVIVEVSTWTLHTGARGHLGDVPRAAQG